jgi:iron complex transport system substrate-binding protein
VLGGNVRFSTFNVLLFAALAASVVILSLFHPVTNKNPLASSAVSPARRTLISTITLSGYTTIDEGAEHIIAVSKPARDWAADGLLNRIYPAIERLPLTGNTVIPDPEQILYLHPDAVFVYTGQAGALEETRLHGLIEVMVDPENPIQSREKIWRRIGEVAGKNARATWLVDRYAAKRAALKQLFPKDMARKVRVACVNVYNGKWWTTSSDYYIAYKLELAWAQNLSKGLRFIGEADLEQLLLLEPDVILFVSSPNEKTTLQKIVGRPEFRSLRAVRERRFYKLPLHTYMNEPVEDPLLFTWMAEIFYPDIMPNRLREEYKETYQDVYHYAVSDDEIDKAIYLEENRHSAGYERFIRQEAGR